MTIRDQLIQKLTEAFGKPTPSGSSYNWSIVRRPHDSVNVLVDSVNTPNRVGVWVFDPHAAGRSGAEYSVIDAAHDIDHLVAQLRQQVSAAGSLQRQVP